MSKTSRLLFNNVLSKRTLLLFIHILVLTTLYVLILNILYVFSSATDIHDTPTS